MAVFLWIIIGTLFLSLSPFLADIKQFVSHLGLFLFIPLLLLFFPQLIKLKGSGNFNAIKLVSICFAALLAGGLRYKGLADSPAWRIVVYLTLFINILEAVGFEIYDVLSRSKVFCGGSFINAAAGIILLATQAYPRFVILDQAQNMHYDLGWPWVVTYTIWNFTFVYGTNPPGEPTGQYSAFAVIHLLSPLLLMRGNPALYLQYRFYTLAVAAMYAFFVGQRKPWFHLVPQWSSLKAARILAWCALLSAGLTVIYSGWNPGSGVVPKHLLESGLYLLFKR